MGTISPAYHVYIMLSVCEPHLGMGFRPMRTVESTLIKFSSKDSDTYNKLVESIEDTLKCKS